MSDHGSEEDLIDVDATGVRRAGSMPALSSVFDKLADIEIVTFDIWTKRLSSG